MNLNLTLDAPIVYRNVCDASGGGNCTTLPGTRYITHYAGSSCTGQQYFYTGYGSYANPSGTINPFNGKGVAGIGRFTLAMYSWRDRSGTCHEEPAWQDGSNVLSGLAPIFNDITICYDGACIGVTEPYISHFVGANCTGMESYYTPYFGSDGTRRSWDGGGVTGTRVLTLSNRSYKDATGQCYTPPAWQPNGNQLTGFVRIYRPVNNLLY